MRKGNIISAHITICEGNHSSFDIVVDIENRKIVSHTHYQMDMFVSQARSKLLKIAMFSTEKTTPKSDVSVWY